MPHIARFLVLSVFAWTSSSSADEPLRPNILWITCEDTSPTLGCYGDPSAETPNLDRLAAAGVRYTCAFSHAGVCAPSRSGLITGMYPTSLGSHHMRSDATLPADVKTLPQLLREAGYYCTNNAKTDYNFPTPAEAWDASGKRAHWRGRPAGPPFFAVFNINVTHESFIRAPFDDLRHDPARARLPAWLPDTPVIHRDWARYHDLVTDMDARAGRLLAELEADGLADETIVFFFSDHGVGLPRAKQWIWDAGLHVPLIVRVPERFRPLAPGAPGTATDRLVSFVDFAPAVLSLAGVPIPPNMQGRAFLGPRATEPRRYVHAVRDRMDERYDLQRAVRDDRFKYFRNYQPYLPYAPPFDYMDLLPTMREWRRLAAAGSLPPAAARFMAPRKPAEELYDIRRDPDELHDLAGDPAYRDVLERMRGEHVRWSRATRDLGLLPEHDMLVRAAGRPQRNLDLPYDRILAAAMAVGVGPPPQSPPQSAADAPIAAALRRLRDPDAAVRFWACQALLDLGDAARPAIDGLTAALDDDAPDVRISAAHALVELGRAEPALPILEAALRHARPEVRLRAAGVVDALGTRAAPLLAAVRRAVRDESRENRYVAWALGSALQKLDSDAASRSPPPRLIDVGVVRVDVTPDVPIRLIGYAARDSEATHVGQRLWAKALAIGDDDAGPALLVTVDLCGVPASLTDALADKLSRSTGVDRSRLAVCATHTHNGPVVKGILPYIFGREVPPDHRLRIDAYAEQLAARLERAARAALADRRPARISWGQGRASISTNRRVLENGRWVGFGVQPDGPVEHVLPVLRVDEPDGRLRAVLLNYACHATTLNAADNYVHGDWPGVAAALIEADHPGATALVAVGCGADSNPNPRGKPEYVVRHGREIADEVNRLLAVPLRPLASSPACRYVRFPLPLAPLPPRAEWEAKAAGRGRDAYYARQVLGRLDRGEPLAPTVPYAAQVWRFGDDLAMIFLPGEVVVDYAVRLKTEFDGTRLWINAYANGSPCYVASKRLLREGGYEVDGSMSSYDRATRLAPEAEDAIIKNVSKLLPESFH